MKPYYKVYRLGGDPPITKHDTLELALEESNRLAAKEPGAIFEILLCLGITSCAKPQTLWNDGLAPVGFENK